MKIAAKFTPKMQLFASAICALLFRASAYAGESSPTLFLDFGGGLTTHKSKFVESNDTSYSTNYSYGVHAGNDGQLTMLVSTSLDNTTFELNSSTIANEFQDSILRYGLGPFYVGVSVSQTKMTITRTDEPAIDIDAIGTGYGGGIGGTFDVGREGSFFFDVATISTGVVKEIHESEFTIGSRLDIAIGGSYAITRSLLNGLVGLRQRSYTLTSDGASYPEVVTTTWFGLALNGSF